MDPEMLVEDVCRTLEQLPQPIGLPDIDVGPLGINIREE